MKARTVVVINAGSSFVLADADICILCCQAEMQLGMVLI